MVLSLLLSSSLFYYTDFFRIFNQGILFFDYRGKRFPTSPKIFDKVKKPK